MIWAESLRGPPDSEGLEDAGIGGSGENNPIWRSADGAANEQMEASLSNKWSRTRSQLSKVLEV